MPRPDTKAIVKKWKASDDEGDTVAALVASSRLLLCAVLDTEPTEAEVERLAAHWYDNRGLAAINGTVMLLPDMPLARAEPEQGGRFESGVMLGVGICFALWFAVALVLR